MFPCSFPRFDGCIVVMQNVLACNNETLSIKHLEVTGIMVATYTQMIRKQKVNCLKKKKFAVILTRAILSPGLFGTVFLS